MVGKVSFQIKGGKEMARLLEELGPRIASRLGDKALRAAARVIIREAKRIVPVRTGELRRSIVGVTGKRGRRDNQRLVHIGFRPPASRRAHLTEFGTRHSAQRPFIRPALDGKASEALETMRRTLADGLARQEFKQAFAEGEEFEEFD